MKNNESEELQFEPLNDGHVNDLLAIWADAEVIRYTNIKEPCTLTEIMDRIKVLKAFDVFVVSNKKGFVGLVGCPCMDQEKSQYGVFYQLRKSCWGMGYATAATAWLLNFMRDKYGEVTFFADVVVDNVASEKILRHFGFQWLSEEVFERRDAKLKVHNYRL